MSKDSQKESAKSELPRSVSMGALSRGDNPWQKRGRVQPETILAGGGARQRVRSVGRRRRASYVVLGLFAVFAVTYGLDLITSIGKVPRGTEVAGVDVGGKTPEDAEFTLVTTLRGRLDDPVELRAGVISTSLHPRDVGLTVDWQGTLDRAGEQPLDPFTRFVSFFTSRPVNAVSKIPDQRLTEFLEQLAVQADFEPREGAIELDAGTVRTVIPQDGQLMQVEGARDAILANWLNDGPVQLPVDFTKTQTRAQDVRALVRDVAEPAISSDVTIVGSINDSPVQPSAAASGSQQLAAPATQAVPSEVGKVPSVDTLPAPSIPIDSSDAVPVTFPRERMGEILTFEREGGQLVPTYHLDAAKAIVEPLLEPSTSEGKDATFAITANTVSVVPAEPGREVKWDQLLSVLPDYLKVPSPRLVPVEYETSEPELSTQDAKNAGITERVADITIDGPGASSTAAKALSSEVNGTFIPAGQSFSLNDLVGARSTQSSLGSVSGSSYVATALYNAAYQAGLEITSRSSLGYDAKDLPYARDASGDGSDELAFTNQQSTGIFIEAFVSGSDLRVRFWGTREFDVTSTVSEKNDVVSPPVLEGSGDGCVPGSGAKGFTVADVRVVSRLDGSVVSRTQITSVYAAVPAVVCRTSSGNGRDGNSTDAEGGVDDSLDRTTTPPAQLIPGLNIPLPFPIPGAR